jgi:PAS domain S-box-containing protein
MTGWTEDELIGRGPPYPYWPPADIVEHRIKLADVLAGKAPASGLELKVLRRDGTQFDARVYVSPLLTDDGEQLGWMSAMADITEPKQISQQLAAAHERFTTVLESLEAAVSVVARDRDDELLFGNRRYRDLLRHARRAFACSRCCHPERSRERSSIPRRIAGSMSARATCAGSTAGTSGS